VGVFRTGSGIVVLDGIIAIRVIMVSAAMLYLFCRCNILQIDPMVVFQRSPLPLGQGILLSLVQQLGVEIEKDTKSKLRWIQEAVLSLNPKDPTVAGHVRGILEEVLSNLHRQATIAGPGDLSNQMRLVTHVVNSMLTACK
jgi:enhancer of mRNA-decapping protein 4